MNEYNQLFGVKLKLKKEIYLNVLFQRLIYIKIYFLTNLND